MNLLKLIFLLSLVPLTFASCSTGISYLPPGWKIPTGITTGEDWRKRDINRYLVVKGDFNGDGILDEAKLLISDNPPGLALFVFLTQADKSCKTFLLDKLGDPSDIQVMGIEKVNPGKYETVCGKSIVVCKQGEADEIILKYDAIDYFKEGGANRFFYWDDSTSTFKSNWIND